MHKNSIDIFKSSFHRDVYSGLTDFPKHLSSKYFYDAQGDKLFQGIMKMPEYYLTDRELEILETHKEEITKQFAAGSEKFNLIELGAGDGSKTKILLKHLLEKQHQFKYLPIDISGNVLSQLEHTLKLELPSLVIDTMEGNYFDVLKHLDQFQGSKKVILFLGSNIGNLLHPKAVAFLSRIQAVMKEQDLLFIGFDQKKHPRIILDAYNDNTGITEAFNKNVLLRINRELGGTFDPNTFLHWEVYDPETGTAKSFLVSRIAQTVTIDQLDLEVEFKAWESIHTEISQKYDDEIVNWLATQAGLQIKATYSDPDQWYKNYVFTRATTDS